MKLMNSKTKVLKHILQDKIFREFKTKEQFQQITDSQIHRNYEIKK